MAESSLYLCTYLWSMPAGRRAMAASSTSSKPPIARPHGVLPDICGVGENEPSEDWLVTLKLMKKHFREQWTIIEAYMGDPVFFLSYKEAVHSIETNMRARGDTRFFHEVLNEARSELEALPEERRWEALNPRSLTAF